jgi:hypothetical protein
VQRKFDKTLETLQHAEEVSQRAVAAIMILLAGAHVEAYLSGSPRANLASLQEAVDKGIEALKAEPPPVGGGAGQAGDGKRSPDSQQWAAQTKLELWIKVLPMLRALEAEGLEITAAEATLLPLAEKFELPVGETIFNAAQFLNNSMAEGSTLGGRIRNVSGTSMLFALAVLIPLALMAWLAWYAIASPPDADADLDEEPPNTEL